MYSMKHKVRYSEISPNKHINIAQVVRYFQDCSTFHSASVGETIDVMTERQRAWMLSGWQLEIERYPRFGEEITINTWPHENKGILAQRNFEMCDAEGNRLIKANSIWFYFDFLTGMPRRIQPEDVECYGVEEKLPMNYKGRKVAIPKNVEGISMESFLVKKSDIDTNGHVNNSKYIEMALEYVEDESSIIGMRADYRKSALLNDRVYPIIYEETGKLYVELKGEKEPFVIIEFEMNGEDK